MSSTWTPELKQKAKELYLEGDPTPENSTELTQAIAEQLGQTVNGVRLVLMAENVYVKKSQATAEAAGTTKGAAAKKTGDSATKSTRVSKESQLDALKAVITKAGGTVDDEILSKLTGKAAAYLVSVFETK